MRQAENSVRIEGILSEVNLEYGSYQKNDKTEECIRGFIKILVDQTINGIATSHEIPVHLYATKKKKDGADNPAYTSIERIKNEYLSIAAAGGEEKADRVRITGASIRMNEYFGQDQRFVSFPRIIASFVNKIKKEDCQPEASFNIEMVVANKGYKLDNDGVPVEPQTYLIKGIVPQYGGKVDIIEFVCANENVTNVVSQYWNEGDTVKLKGRLNFTSKTEVIVEEVDFGEPTEKRRTINISELVITGGSQAPLEGDFAFNRDEISQALAERKTRLEEQKEKDKNRMKKRMAPAPADSTSNGAFDMGF